MLWIPAGWWLPVAVSWGAVAHVAGNWLAAGDGVPLFGPLDRRRHALGLFRIGGKGERAIVWAITAGVGPLLVWLHAPAVRDAVEAAVTASRGGLGEGAGPWMLRTWRRPCCPWA